MSGRVNRTAAGTPAVYGSMPNVSMGYAYYDAAVSRMQDVMEEADAML